MKKPSAEPTEDAGRLVVAPRGPQPETPESIEVSVTPAMPVTADAFMSLHNLITEQDPPTLEDTNGRRPQRRLQKLLRAAHVAILKGSLQQEWSPVLAQDQQRG